MKSGNEQPPPIMYMKKAKNLACAPFYWKRLTTTNELQKSIVADTCLKNMRYLDGCSRIGSARYVEANYNIFLCVFLPPFLPEVASLLPMFLRVELFVFLLTASSK